MPHGNALESFLTIIFGLLFNARSCHVDRQVVPATVGDLLDQMVVVTSARMTPLPPRLDVGRLREAAQLPQRAQLAALAHRIAAFAEGMRAMEKCAARILA